MGGRKQGRVTANFCGTLNYAWVGHFERFLSPMPSVFWQHLKVLALERMGHSHCCAISSLSEPLHLHPIIKGPNTGCYTLALDDLSYLLIGQSYGSPKIDPTHGIPLDFTCRWPPVWDIAVHLAVAGDVFDGVFLCCPFSHEISWMRSGT